jgi:hypothetical protein
VKKRSTSSAGLPARASHPPVPRRRSRHTTVGARARHSTVRALGPLGGEKRPSPQPRVPTPKPGSRAPKTSAPKRQVARILDEDSSLLDLIDNLLNKGVMLNADLILALADVDLVYIRLSALLCAADRVLPAFAKASTGRPGLRPAAGQAKSRRSAQREDG